jgi:hypothetical protein
LFAAFTAVGAENSRAPLATRSPGVTHPESVARSSRGLQLTTSTVDNSRVGADARPVPTVG